MCVCVLTGKLISLTLSYNSHTSKTYTLPPL